MKCVLCITFSDNFSLKLIYSKMYYHIEIGTHHTYEYIEWNLR